MKHLRTRIALLLGLTRIAQGAVMILAPALFYRGVPGVVRAKKAGAPPLDPAGQGPDPLLK
jgi:hypothetical protein